MSQINAARGEDTMQVDEESSEEESEEEVRFHVPINPQYEAHLNII